MQQKTIVITGASDGIGAAAARELKRQGHQVVLVGRSPDKTAAVAREIDAPYYLADFAKLSEVRELAGKLLVDLERIDVFANNAGALIGDYKVTEDGHEMTYQVNHLAPFLLTTLLIDKLVASEATVINTSSAAHQFGGRLHLDELDSKPSRYVPFKAYGRSKLLNILFTKQLDALYHSQGISTAAFHPGVVRTSFSTSSNSLTSFFYKTVLNKFFLSPEQGAETLVWLATAPEIDWKSGEYYEKRKLKKTSKQSYDAQLANDLWVASLAATKLIS